MTRSADDILNQPVIPASIEEARGVLVEMNTLATATEWFRAAIVYAYTHKDQNFKAFADLGFVGLTTRKTVALYHDAWAETKRSAVPGKPVKLPSKAWKLDHKLAELPDDRREAVEEVAEVTGTSASEIARILKHPNVVVAAITADPKLAALVQDALVDAKYGGIADDEALELMAQERAKDESELESPDRQYHDACRELLRAKAALKNFKQLSTDAHFTDKHRRLLEGISDDVQTIHDEGRLALGLLPDTDWDAAASGILNNE